MPLGRVIGATNRDAKEPIDQPVHFQEDFATLSRNQGIDVKTTKPTDLTRWPQSLDDAGC